MKYIKKFNEEYHQEDVDIYEDEDEDEDADDTKSKPLDLKYTIKDMWDLVEFIKRHNPSSDKISKYISLMHVRSEYDPNAVYIDDGIE